MSCQIQLYFPYDTKQNVQSTQTRVSQKKYLIRIIRITSFTHMYWSVSWTFGDIDWSNALLVVRHKFDMVTRSVYLGTVVVGSPK